MIISLISIKKQKIGISFHSRNIMEYNPSSRFWRSWLCYQVCIHCLFLFASCKITTPTAKLLDLWGEKILGVSIIWTSQWVSKAHRWSGFKLIARFFSKMLLQTFSDFSISERGLHAINQQQSGKACKEVGVIRITIRKIEEPFDTRCC